MLEKADDGFGSGRKMRSFGREWIRWVERSRQRCCDAISVEQVGQGKITETAARPPEERTAIQLKYVAALIHRG